jgi:hypothetical protein
VLYACQSEGISIMATHKRQLLHKLALATGGNSLKLQGALLCSAVLCCAVLCCAVLCCAVLAHSMGTPRLASLQRCADRRADAKPSSPFHSSFQ